MITVVITTGTMKLTKMNNDEGVRDPQGPSTSALEVGPISGHSSPMRECSGGYFTCKIAGQRPFSQPRPAEAENHQEIHTDYQLTLAERRRAPKNRELKSQQERL